MKHIRSIGVWCAILLLSCLVTSQLATGAVAQCPNVHTDAGAACLLHIDSVDTLVAQTQYQDVAKWLAKHGVPSAQLVAGEMSGVQTVFMRYVKPDGKALDLTAFDVINSPTIAVYDLVRQKIMADPGYLQYPDPAEQPKQPVPAPYVPPTVCKVGVKLTASWGEYYGNAGVLPKFGDFCSDERGTFKAYTYTDPFGVRAYWMLQDPPAPPPPPPPPVTTTEMKPDVNPALNLTPEQLQRVMALAKMLGII